MRGDCGGRCRLELPCLLLCDAVCDMLCDGLCVGCRGVESRGYAGVVFEVVAWVLTSPGNDRFFTLLEGDRLVSRSYFAPYGDMSF